MRAKEAAGADEPGKERAQLRPVLVIVHGESFEFGAGSTINAFKFVHQSKLVAVTFNYRLNILGKRRASPLMESILRAEGVAEVGHSI